MTLIRITLACALAASALGAQGEIRKPGALVAERVKVTFDSPPAAWTTGENVMDQIWAPLGLSGVNYYLLGGPTAGHRYASRSDPGSPLYQAWVGAYSVVGGSAQFATGSARHDLEDVRKLGELDQRSWLQAMGDPGPVATSHSKFTTDTITIAGARRALYVFDMDSHSDLGAGTTPLAKSIGMPPAAEWQPMLAAFHPLILHVYFAFWRDDARDATIVVYAVSSAFTSKKGRIRDNGPALDMQLRDMMRKVRLVYVPTTK
jgi:hypothetical protein